MHFFGFSIFLSAILLHFLSVIDEFIDKSGDFLKLAKVQVRQPMIDELLVFQECGILLLKRKFSNFKMETQEDLATGFFSAMFQYFSGQFGALKSIKTENKLILVRKIADMYLVLVITLFKLESSERETKENNKSERIWLLNHRLEETSNNILMIIERKIMAQLFRIKIKDSQIPPPTSTMLEAIEHEVDEIIKEGEYKFEILHNLLEKEECMLSEIYQNI